MPVSICMIMTDAVSFNVLCKGQLEYYNNNYDVDITCVCGGSDEDLSRLKNRNVGRVVYLPFLRKPSIGGDLISLFRLWFFLCSNRFDIIVYSTPKAFLLGALASFFSLHPIRIGIIRGRVYENYVGLKRCLYVLFDRVALLVSSDVLAISESLRNSYKNDFKNLCKKIKVLKSGSSNGVDLERFKAGGAKSDSFVKKGFTVGIVGRLCKDKGMAEVFEVFNILKPALGSIRFLIVGKIEDDCSKFVVEEMVRHECVDYVSFTHRIEEVFERIDLHLFLTHREGFGNVAIEAAASSVPTYAFDVVGVKDSVLNGVSGKRFIFGDVKSIAAEIIWASQNYHDFKIKYSRSREWVKENFEDKKVWTAYMEYFTNARNLHKRSSKLFGGVR